jgi:hypothetical protein
MKNEELKDKKLFTCNKAWRVKKLSVLRNLQKQKKL